MIPHCIFNTKIIIFSQRNFEISRKIAIEFQESHIKRLWWNLENKYPGALCIFRQCWFSIFKMNFKEMRRTKQKYRMETTLEWHFRSHLMPAAQREGSFSVNSRSIHDKSYAWNDLFTLFNHRTWNFRGQSGLFHLLSLSHSKKPLQMGHFCKISAKNFYNLL